MYEVIFSKRFEKDLRRLLKKNPRLKNKVRETVEVLIKDPKHKSLRLHKLSGINNWSVTVTMRIRIILSLRGRHVFCTKIGSHDEVY